MTSNTLTDREALYCLCHVPGFGSVTIRDLKDTFGTCLSAWTAKPQELQKSGVLTVGEGLLIKGRDHQKGTGT